MAKHKILPTLSEGQHEVMNAVWDIGKGSVADVWKILNERRSISRNTVHTLLVRLEEKGWLNRVLQDGSVLFTAAATRESTQKECVKRLIDNVFDGSAEGLVLTLLQQVTVSKEEINRIRTLISQARRKKS